MFLLTALVAAAWGAHHFGLTETAPTYAGAQADPVCAYTPGRLYALPDASEIAVSRASFAAAHVCYYTPGQMFAPPSAAQIAQARAGWSWASACLYDPSRGFGALPTAAELAQTRGLLWGMNPLAAAWGSLMAAIGAMSLGHGLLVGGLSIFNPRFITVGWWLLLPEIALAKAGWIGAAGLGTAALTLMAPRYIRRRQSIDAMRRAPRSWLTPKRVAMVGGGWMITVGVLAGVYPNIARLIPQIPGVTVASGAMPKTGGGSKVVADAGATAAQNPATQSAMGDTAATVGGMPPLPPAAGNDGAQNPAEPQVPAPSPSPNRMPNPTPGFSGVTGGNGGAQGGNTADSGPFAATQPGNTSTPAIPATTSFASISSYLPPSSPASVPAATNPAASPTQPAPAAPVQIAANDDGRAAIAETPIIDNAVPLPAGPDTVLPANAPPSQQLAADNSGAPQSPQTPAQPGASPTTLAPASPDALAGDTVPVPEPGMIGLFGLGVLALVRRRAK